MKVTAPYDIHDKDVPLVVCCHTHMPFDRTPGINDPTMTNAANGVRIINAGSIGLPFADPGAYWLLLGPDIQLKHTPYDYEKAAKRIRTAS